MSQESPTRPKLVEQENLDVAARLAQDILRRLDPAAIARKCGAELFDKDGRPHLRVSYFTDPIVIDPSDGRMAKESGDGVPLWEQIIILHYLTHDGRPLAVEDQRPIAFKEIPDGRFYAEPFRRRSVLPLIAVFGEKPALLRQAALALAGRESTGADVAVVVNAFPEAPVTVFLWQGDDEFPPEANLLFRADIPTFFSAEDVAVISGILVGRLKKQAQLIEAAADTDEHKS